MTSKLRNVATGLSRLLLAGVFLIGGAPPAKATPSIVDRIDRLRSRHHIDVATDVSAPTSFSDAASAQWGNWGNWNNWANWNNWGNWGNWGNG